MKRDTDPCPRHAVDGPDDTGLEVEAHHFFSNDEGAPMMCNLVCRAMGRHVHIDYCRAEDAASFIGNKEARRIIKRLLPHPDRPKDFLTHNLFWRRSGPEHTDAEGNAAQPSFCTLPLFHVPMDPNNAIATLGYISSDGHFFSCKNPLVMQIFVVDRSSSMKLTDRQLLRNTLVSDRIIQPSNNRFGAVLSSLYTFCVILFDRSVVDAVVNDFSSSPDQLLDAVLRHRTLKGTNFTAGIPRVQSLMEQHWSTERTPVVIFLSDGQCSIENRTVQDLCGAAKGIILPLRVFWSRFFTIENNVPDRSERPEQRPAGPLGLCGTHNSIVIHDSLKYSSTC
ncbi:hypothetical protein BDR06DRAFT_1010094 [Suillus hirtellus]|nr:hypothetical protein BDR06DRAFT_1010094 [Suillus hirtellus]